VAVIPASSKEKNERRYLNFCRKVSELTSLVNGFSAIQVSHDRIAYKGKVGVDKISNLVFDINLISGRTIYLVDDIITTGASFSQISSKLKGLGAYEVFGIFLAKTHHEYPYVMPPERS